MREPGMDEDEAEHWATMEREADVPVAPTAPPLRHIALNAEQDAAVTLAAGLCPGSAPIAGAVAVVCGYAGTGKTTVLRAILDRMGAKVKVATPTGRAAYRVTQATGADAQTLHSLLYIADEDDEGRLVFRRRSLSEMEEVFPKVLLVDEASMVGPDVWADVQNICELLGRAVLLVGDGEQLFPVQMDRAAPRFSVFAPDFPIDASVRLTQVYRQALDSPVLAAATKVRNATSWQEVMQALHEHLEWLQVPVHEVAAERRRGNHDHVIIAHKNTTRLGLNHWVRFAMGIPHNAAIQEGEPLLVRRNASDLGVCNGEVIPCQWAPEDGAVKLSGGKWVLDAVRVRGIAAALYQPVVLSGEDAVLPKWVPASCFETFGRPFLRAHLGYVLTCHSSQGSEWPEVFVMLEGSLRAMDDDERRRWVYTAITRAQSKVWIVGENGARL